ncbi:hypothetical protein N2152v2_003337 [Parachlorella kessleri]
MADDQSPLELAEVVPRAVFLEDVRQYVQDRSVEEVLRELQENHQKYKHIEQDILQRKRRLLYKEPEIQKALAAVNMLLQRKEEEDATVLDFALSDSVYARARLADVQAVNLWLGAGVMLEYSLEDAQSLLEVQLSGCRKQLGIVQREHEYIKDQLTTTEVCIARVYNFDVSRRREGAAA